MPRKKRTSSKRRTAAKKAARTRARKTAARRRAALKGARTRARRLNPRKRSNPRRRKRATPRRRAAALRRNPAPRRRRRRKNPIGRFDLGRIFKDTLGLAGPAVAVLFLKNKLNNWPAKKDEAGNTVYTVGQRVGPIFPIAFDLSALWAVPKFILKGGLSKHRRDFKTIMSVFLTLDALSLISYVARRGWSMDDAKLLNQGAEGYPEWTDWLSNVEPEPRVKVEGYPYHPGHQHPHAHPHAYLQGPPAQRALPPGEVGSVYDPGLGRFVTVITPSARSQS